MLGRIHQKGWRVFFALLLFSTWMCEVALRASAPFPRQIAQRHCQPDGPAAYTVWHLLLTPACNEDDSNNTLADDDTTGEQNTTDDNGIDPFWEDSLWSLSIHDLSSVRQKVNPHTPPAAAQARLPRYLLFCCWKNDLA